jgi:hypothetical protein
MFACNGSTHHGRELDSSLTRKSGVLLLFCHAITGLRLTDERVASAAAAAQPQVHVRVAQQVAALLQATTPQHAQQHSGLTPLMKFACTADLDAPVLTEVCRDHFNSQQKSESLMLELGHVTPLLSGTLEGSHFLPMIAC